MTPEAFATATASALATSITTGRSTAVQAVEACLARIAERNPAIGAWQHLDADIARAQAREVDQGSRRGRLAGVAVGVKDVIDTADMPTACGSPIHAGRQPAADAACVGRLRAAGMVLPGKTVTTEFAYFKPGRTANPANPAHTPGGSSSGSAAAVAAGMVPLALGTQTAGSTIRPAAFCGVIGYKPTYGAIDMTGVQPLAPSFDTLGLFGRAAGDIALLTEILSDGRIAASQPARPPRLVLARTAAWPLAEPAMAAAIADVRRRAEAAGAACRELVLPAAYDAGTDLHDVIMAVEAARSFRALRATHGDALSQPLRTLCDKGEASAERYGAAIGSAAALAARFDDLIDADELVLTPSAPGEAPRGLEATGNPAFSRMWMLLGAPCLSLPAGRGPAGLPLGVQLVGRRGTDGLVLHQAAWLSDVIGDWQGRRLG